MASVTIHNPTREALDQHEYSSPPVEISPTNPIPTTKYALGRGDFQLLDGWKNKKSAPMRRMQSTNGLSLAKFRLGL